MNVILNFSDFVKNECSKEPDSEKTAYWLNNPLQKSVLSLYKNLSSHYSFSSVKTCEVLGSGNEIFDLVWHTSDTNTRLNIVNSFLSKINFIDLIIENYKLKSDKIKPYEDIDFQIKLYRKRAEITDSTPKQILQILEKAAYSCFFTDSLSSQSYSERELFNTKVMFKNYDDTNFVSAIRVMAIKRRESENRPGLNSVHNYRMEFFHKINLMFYQSKEALNESWFSLRSSGKDSINEKLRALEDILLYMPVGEDIFESIKNNQALIKRFIIASTNITRNKGFKDHKDMMISAFLLLKNNGESDVETCMLTLLEEYPTILIGALGGTKHKFIRDKLEEYLLSQNKNS